MTLKIKDDEKKIANDLLKAYRAGEQKGLTIAKGTPRDTGNPYNDMTGVGKGKGLQKGTPAPIGEDLQLPLFDTRPYNTSSLFIKNVGDKGAKITGDTIFLPTKPKGKSEDITSPYHGDNYYGLQAHGTHVNEPIQPINDQHRWREHVGIDPGGKDITYQDVPLFNKDGKPLGITSNNEGMVRAEYWKLMGQPWVLHGFPPGKEGETQYKKLLKSRNNDLQIAQNVDYGKPTARDKALRLWQREETGGSLRHLPDPLRIQILRDTIPLA